jgi:hypothetical protein
MHLPGKGLDLLKHSHVLEIAKDLVAIADRIRMAEGEEKKGLRSYSSQPSVMALTICSSLRSP